MPCSFLISLPEAIRAIVTYTENPTELLKRRKVKRDVIFQYLVNEKIRLSPQAEKHQLIQATLQLWGAQLDSNLTVSTGITKLHFHRTETEGPFH